MLLSEKALPDTPLIRFPPPPITGALIGGTDDDVEENVSQ